MNNANQFYTSTPNNKINGNGNNISDMSLNATNGHYDDMSPLKNLAKEQLLNKINANTTNGNTNQTTIIAEIEGDIKKKPKQFDKTYYIAKEILLTEVTYKKDLDVIDMVRKTFIRYIPHIPLCFSFPLAFP